jgi:uncharacterized membrane protein
MFGFIFGTACLIGLTVLLVRGPRRWYGRHRHGRGYVLGAVLDRLETTPGQEKAIRSAVEEFSEAASGARREFRASREDLAKAIRSEALDSGSLENAFRRHDGSIGDIRNSFVNALSKIHETLDERQRKTLADMIEAGHWGFRGHHAHGC